MDGSVKRLTEEYAQACNEEALALLRTLGRIPAPTRHEDLRAVFVRDWLLEQGASDVTIDHAKNVVCKLGCDGTNDLVVFAAHTDVVFPDTEDLPMREENDRLYAPGIGDDTANLVHLLMGAKYLIQNQVKLNCGLLIVANACEEGLGNLDGTKAIFAKYGPRIKAFYSFDAYAPSCCNSAVGSCRYRVTCKTRGGHSYADFGAPNAIVLLCALVEKLYQIEPCGEGKTTYNVGRIEGGASVNSIAQECSILYEFRSTSQVCLDEMERRFRSAVTSCQTPEAQFTVELLGVRPGNGPLDQAALEDFTARTVDVIRTFYPGEPNVTSSSTDSNVPLSLGIPANTVGTVVGALAHTREEWVDLSSMPMGQAIALSLMLRYAEPASQKI